MSEPLYELDGWTIDRTKRLPASTDPEDIFYGMNFRYSGLSPDGKRYIGLSYFSDGVFEDEAALREMTKMSLIDVIDDYRHGEL